jgi:hypothetical protein
MALREAGDTIKEAEFAIVLGEPVYLMKLNGGETRIVPVDDEPRAQFSSSEILAALEHASEPYTVANTRIVTQYESYYLDRHDRLPLPVVYAELNDPQRSAFYVDPATAQIVESYNSQSRRNRWLYHGLHSFNFPSLYEHPLAWEALVVALMLGGVALSATAVILAWQVLSRKFRQA